MTYTAGGRFSPVKDITFRGNFTRSIRSPSIEEAFTPKTQAYDSGLDPCDTNSINSGPNPAVRARNCAAAGISQPFASNFDSFTIPVTVSGNPALKDEKANSWTAGVVVRPSFVPGLTIAADYVNISIKNAITELLGTDILNACYDSSTPSSFCKLITRDSTGQITSIEDGYYNAAKLKFSGVTAEISYRFGLESLGLGANAGSLGLSLNYLYKASEYKQVGSGDKTIIAGSVGNPKQSFTTSTTYDNGALNLFLQARYIGKVQQDPNGAANEYEYPTIAPWVVFNGSVAYSISKKYVLRFVVDNLFNRSAPFAAFANTTTLAASTATYYSGLLGRSFHASVTVKY